MDTRNRDSPVVYICSRYSGNIERNTDLARQYSRLAVERGCVPLTPHLLLPQFLSEETEREKAISLDLRSDTASVWMSFCSSAAELL